MNAIERRRLKKGYSQRKLADRAGVSQQAISKWESGAVLPRAVHLSALGRVFGVTVDELLYELMDEPMEAGGKVDGSTERESKNTR